MGALAKPIGGSVNGGSGGAASPGAAQATADRTASLARSAASRAANPSTIELFANLANWAGSGFGVANGMVYPLANNDGSVGGLNRAFVVPANGQFRIATTVRIAGGGLIGFGFSSDAAGSAPQAQLHSAHALVLGDSTAYYQNGANTASLGGATVPDTYVAKIVGDGSTICFSLKGVATGTEYHYTAPYNGDAINNVYIWGGGTAGASGHAVGKLGFNLGLATISPAAGIEDVGPSVLFPTFGTRTARIAFPKGYDSSVGAPVWNCFHGSGTDYQFFYNNAIPAAVANAGLAAGYIIAGASDGNLSTWGANEGVSTYEMLWDYLKSSYGIGKAAMFAVSMGGVESLNVLVRRHVPEIVAWVGYSPATNLAAAYANGNFTAQFKAAYGIAADGSDYANKTGGHDPLLEPGHAFQGVPMFGLPASDDTTIPKGTNWDALAAAVAPYAKEVKVQTGNGNHGWDITPYAASIVAFIDKYAK